MARQREQRWYEVVDGTAYVYDQPTALRSCSVSIVPASQLDWYRRHFQLEKVWTT